MPPKRFVAGLVSTVALFAGCAGSIEGGVETEAPDPALSGTRRPPAGTTRASDTPVPTVPAVPAPTPAAPPAGPGPAPPPAPSLAAPPLSLRRLTREEYDNTVRDLLGETLRPASQFLAEETHLGFENNTSVATVPPTLAEQYLAAAEQLATRATASGKMLVACAPAPADGACAERILATLGRRAWRRPLETEETARLLRVYRVGESAGGFAGGARSMVTALLNAVPFLYRLEVGVATGASGRRPTSWEMASRLSYLFLASMPDDKLFEAAQRDGLTTGEAIAAEAGRLIEDPRAQKAVGSFFRQWLYFHKAEHPTKEQSVFPKWDADSSGKWLREELRLYVDDVFWKSERSLEALLTAPHSFLNKQLASFYGVAPPSGNGHERVALDPDRRSGLLSRGGLLAALAHNDQTSPTFRGKFVREQLLCTFPPRPPDDLDTAVPSPDTRSTTRERLSVHMEKPTCAACHRLMDSIGLGLESYDGVGLWRDRENGKPIDASGELVGTDVDGPFRGAIELQRKLAGSGQVRGCLARQWFRFAFGRQETDADTPTLAALDRALETTGGNVRRFVVALTQVPAFLEVR